MAIAGINIRNISHKLVYHTVAFSISFMIIVAQTQASLSVLTIPAAKSIRSPQILQLPLRLVFRLLRDIRIMQ